MVVAVTAVHGERTPGWTPVPNHWLRNPRLSLKAKGLLGYIASHAENYRLGIKQMLADTRDGDHSVHTALEELINAELVERHQYRNPDGTLGPVTYRIAPQHVFRTKGQPSGSDRPESDADTDRTAGQKSPSGDKQAQRDKRAAQTASQKSPSGDNGSDLQKLNVSAGETARRFSASGKPPCIRRPRKEKTTKKTTTHASTAATASVGPTEPDGGSNDSQRQTKDAIVRAVAEMRPDWTSAGIANAINEALRRGHPLVDIARVYPELAALPSTNTPRLIVFDGDWWRTAPGGSKFTDSNAGRRTDPPRHAQCPHHRGQPAHNCASCRVDAITCENPWCHGGMVQAGRELKPCPACQTRGRTVYRTVSSLPRNGGAPPAA
jgi:hypothetical protein